MYRRMKNLLGVSLIILAIVVSQIPMNDVQADTEGEIGSTQESGIDEGSQTEVTDGNTVQTPQTTNSIDNAVQSTSGNTDSTQQNISGEQDLNAITFATADDSTTQAVQSTDGVLDVTTTGNDSSTTSSNTYKVTFYFGVSKDKIHDWDSIDAEVQNNVNNIAVLEKQVTKSSDGLQPTVSEPGGFKETTKHTISDGTNSASYILKGWFTDTQQSKKWSFDTDTVSGDMTLYAIWELAGDKCCKITYSATGASAYSEQYRDIKAGDPLQEPEYTPIREGASIEGWYYKASDNDDAGILVDWNQTVTKDMVLFAKWKPNEYTVTFDMNGGAYTYTDSDGDHQTGIKQVIVKNVEMPTGKFENSKISDSDYPADDSIIYDTSQYTMDNDGKWYTDQSCLTEYNKESLVNTNFTLYKKLYYTTPLGFTLSADGKTLYEFVLSDDNQTDIDVKIPDTVTTIGPNAFKNMKGIRSITLSKNIKEINAEAFSGMKDVTRTIYVMSGGTQNSREKAEGLDGKYEHFEFVKYIPPTKITFSTNSSLYEPDNVTGDNNMPSYIIAEYPETLPKDDYNLNLQPSDASRNAIAGLMAAAGKTSKDVYYMDITLEKESRGDITYNKNNSFKITMPFPESWQNYELSKDNVKVYSVVKGSDPKQLEDISVLDIDEENGIKYIRFETWHFSDYALVYGEPTTPGGDTPGGDTPGDNPGGDSGNTGGGTGDSGNTGGSGNSGDSGGSSSSGGSGSSGSSGGSGGSGSSSSSSGSGGSSSSGSSGGSSGSTSSQGTTTTPPQQAATTTPSQQGVIQTGGVTGGTAAHVKDSTPKTGDPLEYRTLIVCIFFSVGVLLLLIGNKKKDVASSRYLQA